MSKEGTIAELVQTAENDYKNGSASLGKYVDFSMHETIEHIFAYINSKHLSGIEDSQGREKPFYNIITAIRNIWFRATDIDRKNIRIKTNKTSFKEYLKSFWATQELKEWMRRSKFGIFLNEWGRTLGDYGSAVTKFVEKDGKLIASDIPWNRLIVDAVEFEGNPVIEVFWFTPSQLRKQDAYDQEMVENLIDAREARETIDGQKKDNKSDYIQIYEVHGEFPLSWITEKETDEETYQQQMHVLSFVVNKDDPRKKDNFTLFSGKESKSPYLITHLIREEGRTLAIGSVENTFDAQWMTNHSIKTIKDHLDIASKLLFQTSDETFVGRNVLTEIEQGDILVHKTNEPLTQLNNQSHDVSALLTYSDTWKQLSQEITSTPDALRGATPKSGTAWRQTEAIRVESHSLFEVMRENKGLYVEEMLRQFIVPYLKKEIRKKHSIISELDKDGANKIDMHYINGLLKEQLDAIEGKGEFVDPKQVRKEMQSAKERMMTSGLMREQQITEDLYKDFEWDVDFDITDESMDKDAVLLTLNTVFTTIAINPQILQDKNVQTVFNKIMEEVGVMSPIEFAENEVAQQQANPLQQMQALTTQNENKTQVATQP